MISLPPQESVRKDDGVDDEAVTTRFFITDFAEVIQQNLACAERCTDLLTAVELGSKMVGWDRVASLSISHDVEKCMTWKSLAWKSRLLDIWDQILKNKWSLGDSAPGTPRKQQLPRMKQMTKKDK